MQEALPVLLDVAEPIRDRLRAWLEGTLGWQVVDDTLAAAVPPVCALVDVASGTRHRTTPTVLVVTADDDALTAARAAARSGPAAVARWPEDRESLPELVERASLGVTTSATGMEELRVAGASGGVGTTTVALGLAGLLAWQGGAVLTVSQGAVPVGGLRALSTDDLAGSGTWAAAVPTPGCRDLRVVRCSGGFETAPVDAGPARVLVRDPGRVEVPDVLVLRRDRAGLEALEATAAAVAVVADEGVVPPRAIREVAAHRRLVLLPRSARVARAVAARRVPAGLPGSWLRLLAHVLGRHPQPR